MFLKFNRLITELKLKPIEAYEHLNSLLIKINGLLGGLIIGEINSRENLYGKLPELEREKLIQKSEDQLYFSPIKGNVIFASAIDCWSFTLESFSPFLTDKINLKKEEIQNYLWGEYYYDLKTKQVQWKYRKAIQIKLLNQCL